MMFYLSNFDVLLIFLAGTNAVFGFQAMFNGKYRLIRALWFYFVVFACLFSALTKDFEIRFQITPKIEAKPK